MRITFVLPRSGHQPIGGFKVVYEYANGLVQRGHAVTVIHAPPAMHDDTSNLKRVERLLKFSSRAIGLAGGYRPHRWFQVDPRVRMNWVPSLHPRWIPSADVVVATAWQTAEWIALYPREKGRKYYLIQGVESCFDEDMKDRVMSTWSLPLQKIVIARWLQHIAEDLNGAARLIPNGLDFTAFNVDIPVTEREHDRLIMLYHDKEFKGSYDGLAAMEQVKKHVPTLKATLFGVPSAPNGLPSWIIYQQKPDQTLLRHLYNEAAIFVGPSWVEGWGLTGSEAAQCGAALCVTDIGGHREYAIPDVTALVSPPRDPESLAANILALIKDKEKRVRIALSGNEYVQQFTWVRAIEAFEEYLLG